jgi:pyruvate,water dikinase
MRDLLSIFRRMKFTNKLSQSSEQLQEKYHCFQKMLSETNAVRVIMADMEEKLSGDYLFDMYYIRSNLYTLSNKMPIIIDSLYKISDGKYLELYDVFKRADSEIQAILTKRKEIGSYTEGMANMGWYWNCLFS